MGHKDIFWDVRNMSLILGGGNRSVCLCEKSSSCIFKIKMNGLTQLERKSGGGEREKEKRKKEEGKEGREGGREGGGGGKEREKEKKNLPIIIWLTSPNLKPG